MFGSRRPELKTPDQLRLMRRAGQVVAQALAATSAEVRAGITTCELDAVAAEVIASAGAEPSFLDYGADINGEGGFPGVICVSVNDEVVHGIPGDRVLQTGDLVSIDCGAIVEGWHGDAARSVFVGEPGDPAAVKLSQVTHDALWAGIGAARLGGRVTDISAAIEEFVTAQGDYGIAEGLVGHGIGSAMHMEPDVPNEGRPGRGPRITEGLALAVEPMLTLGSSQTATLDDEWTMVTVDGSWAAHWEHTITVTEHGLWVLTAEDGGEELLAKHGLPFGPLSD